MYGPVKTSLHEIINIILYQFNLADVNSINQIKETVLIDIRLPRIFLAVLIGAGLGTSGAILQGLFRNPLVDPGFIGISSGAAVGAMIAIMFSKLIMQSFFEINPNFIIPIFAMSGSFFTTIIIYKMSKVFNKTNIMVMLLSGIAINALSGSIIGFLVTISSDIELRSFTFWSLGGLDAAEWQIVFIMLILITIPYLFAHSLIKKLDIFMLGDSEAQHLGINIEKLKRTIILISSIMVGISVAFCGMIGFVGLVTPHLIRLCIGPNHKYLIPGSALLGAIIILISDLISKSIIAPAQLPLGVVTSTIGAPFFIWLIINQKRRFYYS
tara:strand:- start:260 stop:1237 length:978 start_codon:yes stop_codon:yes gene_type:complete